MPGQLLVAARRHERWALPALSGILWSCTCCADDADGAVRAEQGSLRTLAVQLQNVQHSLRQSLVSRRTVSEVLNGPKARTREMERDGTPANDWNYRMIIEDREYGLRVGARPFAHCKLMFMFVLRRLQASGGDEASHPHLRTRAVGLRVHPHPLAFCAVLHGRCVAAVLSSGFFRCCCVGQGPTLPTHERKGALFLIALDSCLHATAAETPLTASTEYIFYAGVAVFLFRAWAFGFGKANREKLWAIMTYSILSMLLVTEVRLALQPNAGAWGSCHLPQINVKSVRYVDFHCVLLSCSYCSVSWCSTCTTWMTR